MATSAPLFSIGVIADAQYASRDDGDTEGRVQRFREVPAKLEEACVAFAAAARSGAGGGPPLAAVLHLGDLVQGSPELEQTRADRVGDVLERDVAAGSYARLDAGWLALAATLGYCKRRHTAWAWAERRPALAGWFEEAAQRAAFQATMPPFSGL